MYDDVLELISILEEATEPSAETDIGISELLAIPLAAFTGSMDAALSLEAFAPGWYIDHAGDNAVGVAGFLRVIGHTVEYANGLERVQGDAPTKPLAYCLAILKAYRREMVEANRKLMEALGEDGRISAGIKSDIAAVFSNFTVPFACPETEIDEDDHSIVLRWSRGDRSLSLTFLGKGFVGGCLTHPKVAKPAFRHEAADCAWLRTRLTTRVITDIILRRPEKQG